MISVTQRINQVVQPAGGYLNPKGFTVTKFENAVELKQTENIHNNLVGIVVEGMTRYLNGASKEEVFKISLLGAQTINEGDQAQQMLEEITGLDDLSITNACKLAGYDVCYSAAGIGFKPVQTIEPDTDTLFNIRLMIQRSLEFIKKYGPTIKDGFSFDGGYTAKVTMGDGDFLTENTLWDFKVTLKPLNMEFTLELLMHYFMGLHTRQKEFRAVKNLGLFNPRLNIVYLIETRRISQETKERISREVIGY